MRIKDDNVYRIFMSVAIKHDTWTHPFIQQIFTQHKSLLTTNICYVSDPMLGAGVAVRTASSVKRGNETIVSKVVFLTLIQH